jgi:hypothetical protein
LTRDAGIQYGGETFRAASYFARRHSRSIDRAELTQDARGAPDAAAPPLGGAAAFARLLVRLPRIDVRLSDSSPGREIDAYLRARARGLRHNCIAQGVLPLPEQPADYLRGRSRQAVRTNLHRAEAARLRCRAVLDLDERLDAATVLGMQEWNPKLVDRPRDPVWVARDGESRTVGLLWATVDSEWTMLRLLAASCSEARYALHTALVCYLCSRGARYLFARKGCALLLQPGLQYFQQLLGYRVAHLRLRRNALGAVSPPVRHPTLRPKVARSYVTNPLAPSHLGEVDRVSERPGKSAEPRQASRAEG